MTCSTYFERNPHLRMHFSAQIEFKILMRKESGNIHTVWSSRTKSASVFGNPEVWCGMTVLENHYPILFN